MKWFFALNQGSGNFEYFADMIKVAVYSAARHTKLQPHFLYDGEDNHLTEWLRAHGVEVIFRRSFLKDRIFEVAAKLQKPHIRSIAPGAFLRTELPALASERGWTDDLILYTDCDVLFLKDVVDDLHSYQPRYFAVSAEEDPNNFINANTGVMLMNPQGLLRVDKQFRKFMEQHLEQLCLIFWDQTAYQWYFNSLMRFMIARGVPHERAMRLYYRLHRRHLCPKPQWDSLPIEYNWKPYWASYENAKIIHFHGPKPYEREILSSEDVPEHLKHLVWSLRGSYFELCDLWEQSLKEANGSNWTASAVPSSAQ